MLNIIQSKKGELAYCEKEDNFYLFDGKEWIDFSTVPNPSFKMNMYELNKMIIEQLQPLTPEEKTEKYKVINKWQKDNRCGYIMMLGKEIGYYTIFRVSNIHELPNLGEGILQCLDNIGKVYSIEINDQNAIEIWVKPNLHDDVTVLYVFPYDQGIVTIGE